LPTLAAGARRLAPHGIHLFVLHEGHFLDPLVEEHRLRLAESPAVSAAATLRVVSEVLPARLPDLATGIYFPVPLGRDLEKGGELTALLERYHYDFIEVDEDREWWWRGQRVASRTRRFFHEHLAWEPEVERYFFEYQVNEGWWDKCYLDCRTPPLVARTLAVAGGEVRVELDNGRGDRVDPASFRLDQRERLLCRTALFGEVTLSDALRFSVLRGLADDGSCLVLTGGKGEERMTVPLAWPVDARPPASPGER
jgi:hypothetical protein